MPCSTDDHRSGDGDRAELAVVGAGPAGLAAAVTAADHGLAVVLLDASVTPGGQYYRSPADGLGATRPAALHHAWPVFAALSARLAAHRASGAIRHLPGHQVWTLERAGDGDWVLHAVTGTEEDRHSVVRARRLLLATGAHERQLPFPGWTLPGVVGAAGAQALLKSGLVLPGRRIVVAGSGPLLQAVALSLTRAGASVPVLIEASGYGVYARAPGVLAANPGKLAEGVRHGASLTRAGVRVLTHRAVTEVHGDDRVEAVTVSRVDRQWRPLPGTGREIACDALAVGHGLVPQLELALAAGCDTRVGADGTHAVTLDERLRTTVPGVWAAGETGGIGGVELALCEGELAALSISCEVRDEVRRTAARRAVALRRARRRLRAFASLMGAVHRPGAGWREWLTADTEVCRCEEVTAGRIRTACEELGAGDTRTVKLLTRAGMGWCQGRTCGFAVRELAAAHGTGHGTGGGSRRRCVEEQEGPGPDRRPLACPVTLSTLAGLTDPGETTATP
ncbi:FAD/NAD(P)-dependent oxidoreductase [Streptomyces sp. NBC_01217]|uniref:FAD/NAD(P)-dependent oxidoreductase n=1 Tax=Streptomyces sp. NBC_01217 TaxID=2903779 RepID=UPI002E122692|nr:NAD(P)/FAD-dependent oxidoreductase [Streptomyces sp. NBC_01217]